MHSRKWEITSSTLKLKHTLTNTHMLSLSDTHTHKHTHTHTQTQTHTCALSLSDTHTLTNTHVRLPSPILLNGITPPGIVQYCNATQAVTCCAFLAGPWSAITFGNAFGNACGKADLLLQATVLLIYFQWDPVCMPLQRGACRWQLSGSSHLVPARPLAAGSSIKHGNWSRWRGG